MRRAVVTIGVFDGVHRGHAYVIRETVDRARALGLPTFAVTFHPHPDAVLHPERQVTYLSDPDEKVALIKRLGVDEVWTCRFTPALSQLDPEAFMHLVAERQPLAELWVGADFALGRGRSGTLAVLAEIGGRDGWALHMLPPLRLRGEVVSSTAIRGHLLAGELEEAAELLGRPYALRGEVQAVGRGEYRLLAPPERAVPGEGVYAGRVRVDGVEADAAVAVSPSPNGSQRAHVLRLRLREDAAPLVAPRGTVALLARLRSLEAPELAPTDADVIEACDRLASAPPRTLGARGREGTV